ncbi:MAG: plasma-membrane proton-efflux P-type ATPase [Thermoprotei archaeon]
MTVSAKRVLTPEDWVRELEVDPGVGLKAEQVAARLKKYGYNEVPEKRESKAKMVVKKFWGFTAWMLEITLVATAIIRHYVDSYIIGALLVTNAMISYVHESSAEKAVELLENRLQVTARVQREGKWDLIPARELVPGDVIRLRAGDIVPADAVLISKDELEVDQSVLTGESMPVVKVHGDVLYSGSIVRRGEATAIVTATGTGTFFGKTVQLVQVSKPKLHMEEITSNVVLMLLAMVVSLLAFVFASTYLSTRDVDFIITYLVPLALTLVVFAVPVALPAMFTVSMAVGAEEMARRGAIVTKLSAIEDAASMTVLCADKTGTLTYNRLRLTDVFPLDGYTKAEVIAYGFMASQEANRDPIDVAFIESAKGLSIPYKVKQFKPFDPSTKRTEALVSDGARDFWVAKGSLSVIEKELVKQNLSEQVNKVVSTYASKGYRVLGVAAQRDGRWELVGLAALYDTPREDTPILIRKLEEMGIKVKMLTGDAAPIANEIARSIGLQGRIVTGSELRSVDASLPEIASKATVFADIYPEDKHTIVKSLQKMGEVVGMTGDGVNDAPALKQAEVGIAVSGATDVAKASASVVLTVEGLRGIVDLVRIGRTTYQRIVTWILNKIIKTFEIAVFVALAFIISAYLLGRPIYVISATDVILFLFLIDFVTLSLSTDNAKGSPTPEKWELGKLLQLGLGLGVFTVAEMFGLLYLALEVFHITQTRQLHTFFFVSIMFMGVLTPFIVRERGHFWVSKPSKWLVLAATSDLAIVVLLGLFGLGIVEAISVNEVVSVAAYALFASFVVNDAVKLMLGKVGISR